MTTRLPRIDFTSGVHATTPLTVENVNLMQGHDLVVMAAANRIDPNLTVERWWPGHYRIKETDLGYLDVVRMLTNWRLCLTDFDNFGYSKGYCFNGPEGLSSALKAGLAWSGEGEVDGPWYRAIHANIKRPEYING